jgi:hypothetical protein
VDGNRQHFVLNNRGNRHIPVVGNRHRGSVSGVNREALHAIDQDRLDVGDTRNTKRGQLLLRKMPHVEHHGLLLRRRDGVGRIA